MIRLFDNLLGPGDHQKLQAYLQGQDWSYGAYSDNAPTASRYLYKHFAGHFRDGEGRDSTGIETELAAFPPIAELWKGLKASCMRGHVLTRCYANAYPLGSEGGLHRDALEPDHYTAIYYPHLRWDPNYAGETVFFNDEGTEIVASVYPKPNRLVLFAGTIPHVARGVSRQCPDLRITLMFKTVLAQSAQAPETLAAAG